MNDDYLWNRSGHPDPAIERLEKLLGHYRHSRPAPDFYSVEIDTEPPTLFHRVIRSSWSKLAVAALLILCIGVGMFFRRMTVWEIQALSGVPVVAGSQVDAPTALHAGDAIETDHDSRAKIRVGAIGFVDVGPGSRLKVVVARATKQHLDLEEGRIKALISAPPRLFVVGTPAGKAIDLGCAYTLDVDSEGQGLLSVTLGWVALENGRKAWVPAGASCRTDPRRGPGTPVFEDASVELREAIDRFDFDDQTPEERLDDLWIIVRQARTKDLITLWHLLMRTEGEERILVTKGISLVWDLPPDIRRQDLVSGDPDAIARLGRELGVRETTWWKSFLENLAF